MLTNLSTEQLVGLNGAAFKDGLSVMAWEVIAVVALVLMALFFLPRFLKSGITTVPQFLEIRFDSQTRIITTFIFVIAYAGLLLPIILYTGAKGLNGMLDLQALTGLSTETQQLWATVWLVGHRFNLRHLRWSSYGCLRHHKRVRPPRGRHLDLLLWSVTH